MTKRFGFTLAEVLITLGIIGVVAAMTMPTLINQTNGAQYKAAYKKALSALSQAVTLNVALDDWSFADIDADNTIGGMLTSRMNVVRDEAGNTNISDYTNDLEDIDTNNRTLFFNDGIMFTYPVSTDGCTREQGDNLTKADIGTQCFGYIDVNGLKGPNKVVKCDGQTDYKASVDDCTVTSPTDIYPVVYFDQSVLPSTDAARAVLYGK